LHNHIGGEVSKLCLAHSVATVKDRSLTDLREFLEPCT